jgi:membrane-associated phospholipid phosphatase
VTQGPDQQPLRPSLSSTVGPGTTSAVDWLSRRLTQIVPFELPQTLLRVLTILGRWDQDTYEAVARMSTPLLDEPMRVVSQVANHSKPWLATAAALTAFGGRDGRRAALTGLAAVAATSLVVNLPLKLAGSRRRPDRVALDVPSSRWVDMPSSGSFPSGHSASAAAFAVAVGAVLPRLLGPLGVAGVTVAFSRVYTGVHYPGDVVVGAVTGAAIGRATASLAGRVRQQT